MTKSTKQVAITAIQLGSPTSDNGVYFVDPGSTFDCPLEELDFLQSSGACRDPESRESDVDPVTEGSPPPADIEGLIQEAKALGVKGVTKNMKAATIQARIDRHRLDAHKEALIALAQEHGIEDIRGDMSADELQAAIDAHLSSSTDTEPSVL